MRTNPIKLFVLFLTAFVFIASTPAQNGPGKKQFVVVLDAGHGGKDPGNRGGGFKEKDIALNIVLQVGRQLEKDPNVKVIYTRDKDIFIPLDQRAKIANEAKADLFVSVHCNAHNSQAYGTETFVLGLHRNQTNFEVAKRENSVIFLEEDYDITYGGFDPNSPESYIGMMIMQEEYLEQSILLADFVQKKFTNDLKRNNRGVKQAGFLVLHQTYMPSVLIETGFLTNNSEGAYLNSSTGQSKMAEAITNAIVDYSHTINLATLENISEEVAAEIVTSEPVIDIYDGVTFKVQLAASSKKLEPKSSNFKGLTPVFREKEGKLYKYYYGATSSYSQIQKLHQQAKAKGYPSSYVVAFREGNKITVNEALNSQSK
ncbi:N-acetylmuramoyl-L-alanine amidase [Antarcticibacterium flavum]|uniref:N-acetylmuramoyl-L-alanine amidase n=1 Tax=Antarcticibacterium flavum TaxID=2058175 RepID=A0A5B7WYH2_9FLAO|nr:N-acetylmuramoyl-L-alanine amidase [Antarcticibacterium sp. W02-3]MCM4158846.1 N-acetylmuramoyl-L-alanine amidase [Antarcticibacterium sp. W02-3]QCY68107.1 N-acetylmuramoyl-L-alanine amidase [Antarcticibacterium flavum]